MLKHAHLFLQIRKFIFKFPASFPPESETGNLKGEHIRSFAFYVHKPAKRRHLSVTKQGFFCNEKRDLERLRNDKLATGLNVIFLHGACRLRRKSREDQDCAGRLQTKDYAGNGGLEGAGRWTH